MKNLKVDKAKKTHPLKSDKRPNDFQDKIDENLKGDKTKKGIKMKKT